ncbi:MAG: NADH-quinone oxidoreductase subunit G [Actinomycetota bacterium]
MSNGTVTLTIDDREITVPAGTLVIRAAEQLGIYIPRFCDHPLLDPAGACRQCIVDVEGQRKPLTSCTTVCTEGMVVRTQLSSDAAAEAQRSVLELLLINHPLDCPMCDKGGECPLQDQALEYGPGGSRYIDTKRRFTKPVAISPLIKLDRERCVLCARCTRFSDQIADDPFIELFERGALEQVAIYEDEPYRSEYSGNVVQICPVGALTSSEFRFQARPFDMTTTVSTCNRCASGCQTLVQERRGQLVRVLSSTDPTGQDEWICDKGRFGYLYAQTPERVTEPLVRKGDGFVAVSWAEAISTVAAAIRETRDSRLGSAVLGGSISTDEDAYALSRFARVVLATNDIDHRLGGSTPEDYAALGQIASGVETAGFADIDAADTIVIAGADLREVSPIVALRIRKRLHAGGVRVIEVAPRASRLIENGASWVPVKTGAEAAALRSLESDGRTILLVGDALIGDGSFAHAWNLALDRGWKFGWVPRRANARGAVAAGCLPTALPGGRSITEPEDRAAVQKVWNSVPPDQPGREGAAILREAAELGFLLIVGADPVADAAGSLKAASGIDAAGFVVSIDMFLTETARRADVVLPAAAVYERAGSITSWEGRRSRVRAAIDPPGLAQEDREILAQIATELGHSGFPRTAQAVQDEMARLSPDGGAPRPVPTEALDQTPAEMVLCTYPLLIDSGAMMHGSDALAATAHPAAIEISPDDAARLNLTDGQLVRVTSSHGSLKGPIRVEGRVANGVVFIPAQHSSLEGVDLQAASGVTTVRIEKEGP